MENGFYRSPLKHRPFYLVAQARKEREAREELWAQRKEKYMLPAFNLIYPLYEQLTSFPSTLKSEFYQGIEAILDKEGAIAESRVFGPLLPTHEMPRKGEYSKNKKIFR